MSTTIDDLQPKPFTVKLQGKEYTCEPLRLSHKLIIAKVQPLIFAIAEAASGKQIDIDSADILTYEKDLDTVFNDLMPGLKDIRLNDADLVSLLDQLLENSVPSEVQKLTEEKVITADPKVTTPAPRSGT